MSGVACFPTRVPRTSSTVPLRSAGSSRRTRALACVSWTGRKKDPFQHPTTGDILRQEDFGRYTGIRRRDESLESLSYRRRQGSRPHSGRAECFRVRLPFLEAFVATRIRPLLCLPGGLQDTCQVGTCGRRRFFLLENKGLLFGVPDRKGRTGQAGSWSWSDDWNPNQYHRGTEGSEVLVFFPSGAIRASTTPGAGSWSCFQSMRFLFLGTFFITFISVVSSLNLRQENHVISSRQSLQSSFGGILDRRALSISRVDSELERDGGSRAEIRRVSASAEKRRAEVDT